MRPKAASKHGNRSPKVNIFRNVERTPSRYTGAMVPLNMLEQKERFLRFGVTPTFTMKGSTETLTRYINDPKGEIRRTYFNEAKNILETVKEKFGDGGDFIETMYGERIGYVQASKQLAQYLKSNHLQGEMTIYWAPDLSCSAKIVWKGPSLKCNRPEARKYTLLLNCNSDNMYLRSTGINCLANHEIGTHYFRMFNDGFQPWYSDRKKFGMRPMSSRESNATEEGLATISTVLRGKTKYLWSAALLYYTACMAEEMTFIELFDHIGQYIQDKELRWRHVMRIKRALRDPSAVGGYGNDQVYFEGAVEILRNYEKIDIPILYAGKVCWDEVNRVKRLARKDCLRLPHFIRDLESYKKKLYQIGVANGLVPKAEKRAPSPSKWPLSDRRTQMISPFRRRKMLESGFVGAPCLPPFLPYGTPLRPRKQLRNSFEDFQESKQASPKLSAEIIFVNEAPSVSTIHGDQYNTDFNNHCNHIESEYYEYGPYERINHHVNDYEYFPYERMNHHVNYQQSKRNKGTGRQNVYLIPSEDSGEENVFEETFILPGGNCNTCHVLKQTRNNDMVYSIVDT